MEKTNGFYAYPAHPKDIGDTIERALTEVNNTNNAITLSSWKAMDIAGHFISEEVLNGIDNCNHFIGDISVLNFNVTYEIGYAIGRKKRVVLTKNKSILEGALSIRDVGIFDTLGYAEYQNSIELASLLKNLDSKKALDISGNIDTKAPVYLLETKHKTDWSGRIVSRIKKSKYIFRSFDPNESPRLSAYDAISQVSKSHGVVVPLLSETTEGFNVHNMRAAFIAGLADGMNKALCILQHGESPVPLDYRDFVTATFHPDDVNDSIAEFAGKIAEAFQQDDQYTNDKPESYLRSLDLGASSAENEMRDLGKYYLKTDQFQKSLRGEAHLVVGRKGSGKSAIFLQIRDKERNKVGNITLDLKPDGYKLIKFKELILDFIEEGTFQHTIMAFWEYVLLLEICYKILEKDRETHLRDHDLYEPYRKLSELYRTEGYVTEGDFSERMSGLMEKISTEYRAKYGDSTGVRLSASQVTEILYFHDVRVLAENISSYMKSKGVLWLLFDNIDKGWPTSGLRHEDLIIIRSLIDATRKIERQFEKSHVEVNSILFLRNDVYELLVKETADRGKEASVLLDWTDPDLLRELIRLRLVANNPEEDYDFVRLWPKLCISHYKGEESSQFLIERSLMRPRFLLNLINQCKSFAINLNHQIIQADDIEKGLSAYSTDLLSDIGYEIQDVDPHAEGILYEFIGSQSNLSHDAIITILNNALKDKENTSEESSNRIFDLLLWYGLLGIKIDSNEIRYIYNFNYNMQLFRGFIKKQGGNLSFVINPAFWSALVINES